MITPDPKIKYENYLGQVLKSSQLKPGYTIKELSQMTRVPAGAYTRYIQQGKIPQAYRQTHGPDSKHRYAWVIPLGPNIARIQQERRTRLAHTAFSHLPNRRLTAKFKTVNGVRYKLCRACIWQRGLEEKDAWHPATELYFHRQGDQLYSICKVCRLERFNRRKPLLLTQED